MYNESGGMYNESGGGDGGGSQVVGIRKINAGTRNRVH